MVTILACTDKKALKLFEQLPEQIHRNNPYFVPPFPGSVVKVFSSKSPILKHGELIPFLAFKEGKPVGRIAAVVNRAHNAYYNDKTGFFGFFDFIDDPEVAKALFEAAKKELQKHGLTSIRGPYNPTSNDECGLLTEGFEVPPMVMMPFNAPYYLTRYEEVGLKSVRDLYAYYILSSAILPEKVGRVVERVKKKSGLTFRNIEMKKLNEELKIIQELYNATLKRNWGFVPVTYEDLLFAAEDLKAIVDPEFVIIAEKEGVPVGFSMVLPNINELMFRAKKSTGLIRVLKFIWYLKTKKPKEARMAVLGVKPEYENSGIPAVFYFESLARGKNVFVGGELSWIEESNVPMMRSLELIGGKRYKTYKIYETAV